jgi:hypothetical protein
MKVKYNNITKEWTVITMWKSDVVFTHKSKDECYEWIFSQMSYV